MLDGEFSKIESVINIDEIAPRIVLKNRLVLIEWDYLFSKHKGEIIDAF